MKAKTELKLVSGRWTGYVNGKKVCDSANKYYAKQKLEQLASAVAEKQETEKEKAVEFPINQRFEFLTKICQMVAKGTTPSAIVVGEGGLGKSYSVIKALEAAGLKCFDNLEDGEYVAPRTMFRVVKGYSTPKGLYRILFENQKNIIVFDDCDSIQKDPDALNLLKGALDSFEKRWITWNTSSKVDDLPRSFEFKGGVIFVSNIAMSKLDQALRTRSVCVDLAMSEDQKVERMEFIAKADEFLPTIDLTHKQAAIDLIKKNRKIVRELSLRTLITVTKFAASGEKDWEQLAKYVVSQ